MSENESISGLGRRGVAYYFSEVPPPPQLAGFTILWIGVTVTFVLEDLEFIGMSAPALRAINPHLVPLIAHDRAGFGGAVLTMGLENGPVPVVRPSVPGPCARPWRQPGPCR